MGGSATTIAVEPRESQVLVTRAGLKHALSNLALAAMFLTAALPSARSYNSGLANLVFLGGAVVMAAFSLVRVPARTVRVDVRAISATVGMLVFPALMRPEAASSGLLMQASIGFETGGVIISQVARIYMGRSFGLFPANRGIVSRGPFAVVRHPIYLGWLMLTIGFACAYPTLMNWLMIVGSLAFLNWRIRLEESLLIEDPEYRAYQARVPFQVIPGII